MSNDQPQAPYFFHIPQDDDEGTWHVYGMIDDRLLLKISVLDAANGIPNFHFKSHGADFALSALWRNHNELFSPQWKSTKEDFMEQLVMVIEYGEENPGEVGAAFIEFYEANRTD
ncbi:MAG: hypothetical protein V4649_02910 [Bacteroidota bacterium]